MNVDERNFKNTEDENIKHEDINIKEETLNNVETNKIDNYAIKIDGQDRKVLRQKRRAVKKIMKEEPYSSEDDEIMETIKQTSRRKRRAIKQIIKEESYSSEDDENMKSIEQEGYVEDETSDTDESVMSVEEGQPISGTRRRQKPVLFTTDQEKDLAVWLEAHTFLYDKGDPEYRNKPRKDRVKKEKGDSMVPPVSPQELERWIRSMRTRYGKLTKSKSDDGNDIRVQSERDKWILKLFSFIGRHIQRSQQPKTLGPKESAVTAPLPPTPSPTCDVVEIGRRITSPTTSSSSGTSPIRTEDLILDKVFDRHQRAVSQFLEAQMKLKMAAVKDEDLDFWRTVVSEPLAHLLKGVDRRFAGKINAELSSLVYKYQGLNFDIEQVRDRNRMAPPPATPQPSHSTPGPSNRFPSLPDDFKNISFKDFYDFLAASPNQRM